MECLPSFLIEPVLNLPSPSHDVNLFNVNREYLGELSYNVVQLSESLLQNVTNLNAELVKSFKVISSIDSNSECLFYLDPL